MEASTTQLEDVKEALDRVDAPQAPSLAGRIDALYRELRPKDPSETEAELVKAERTLIGIGYELDHVAIPRSLGEGTIEPVERVQILARRYLAQFRAAGGALTPMSEAETESLYRHLAAGAGWKGTQSAEGTRRRAILEAIDGQDVLSPTEALEFADAIECALLQAEIDESPTHGGPAIGVVSVGMGVRVPPEAVAGEGEERKPTPPSTVDLADAAAGELMNRIGGLEERTLLSLLGRD